MNMRQALGALCLVACGSTPSTAHVSPAAPPVTVASATPPPAPDPVAAPAPEPTPVDPLFASLPASLPLEMPKSDPKAMKRSGKIWPFHAWDHAEAVVYNWQPGGPGQERVYDDDGWNTLKYRAALDQERATWAVAIVQKQHGELLVSKCAFPRHAVVLFDGDTPVASINVCFTCHDIELWPAYTTKPLTEADYTRMAKTSDVMLPAWKHLFADELHFPLWSANH